MHRIVIHISKSKVYFKKLPETTIHFQSSYFTASDSLDRPERLGGNISLLKDVGALGSRLTLCEEELEFIECCSGTRLEPICIELSKDCASIEFSWTIWEAEVSSLAPRKEEPGWPKLVSPSESSTSILLCPAFPREESEIERLN